MSTPAARAGFSLVELIIALLILTVGIFALGASSMYVLAQVRASELRAERTVAVRDAAESLRAVPWPSLPDECANRTFQSGRYSVRCTVLPSSSISFRVLELVSEGPGHLNQDVVQSAQDTSVISIAQPAQ